MNAAQRSKLQQKRQVERMFSIRGEREGTWLAPIPWRIIAIHEQQALKNHQQPLEHLQQCGGLSPKEALHVLHDLSWDDYHVDSLRIRNMTVDEADRSLRELVALRVALAGSMQVPCTHGPRPDFVDARGLQKCPQCGEMINGNADGF